MQQFYQTIEALPEGSTILLSFDYGPSAMPELNPMATTVMEHAMRKNLKVISIALWPDGHPFSLDTVRRIAEKYEKKYGEDYAALGYMPGISAVILGIGENIRKTFPKDALGGVTENMPLLVENSNYDKIGLTVCFAAGATPDWWIALANQRYGETVLLGVTGVMAANYYPYINTGQVQGLLGGLKGAAEYQLLVYGQPTPLTLKMLLSQSLVHLYIIILIILGNLLFFFSRKRQVK